MSSMCAICGGAIGSDIPTNWHPGKRARRVERAMEAHLKTHSFAEVLRYEIRQDIDQVPEDQRPGIVRDIYRSLLGQTNNGLFTLDDADGRGVYSIDEVLGTVETYRFWRSANRCGQVGCRHAQV
jgi:hypothetical protein